VYRGIIALGLCMLATVTGCSVTSGSEDGDDPPATEDQKINGADLSGAELCEMVPQKFVRDNLEIAITRTKPWDRDKEPVTIASCRYETAAEPSAEEVSVDVSIWPGRVNAKDRVKLTFNGLTGQPRGKYEEVDGLGDAAGFGPMHEIPDVYMLEVVTTYEDAYRNIDVKVFSPEPPTLDQLRPIAERVLQQLTE
jgi:hypothetical protein